MSDSRKGFKANESPAERSLQLAVALHSRPRVDTYQALRQSVLALLPRHRVKVLRTRSLGFGCYLLEEPVSSDKAEGEKCEQPQRSDESDSACRRFSKGITSRRVACLRVHPSPPLPCPTPPRYNKNLSCKQSARLEYFSAKDIRLTAGRSGQSCSKHDIVLVPLSPR